MSRGLAIGYREGFDSSAFMAHVYANRPVGRTHVGRALDRRLLSRRTCEAFRDIRGLAAAGVLDAIDTALAAGVAKPLVVDVAAGPAPYLLDVLAVRPTARAVLRDIDPHAVRAAAAEAQRRGLGARVECAVADAFNVAASAAAHPRVDIVLELGLYGIYHDDARVAAHLRELGDQVRPSQIVCNVQVRNPEIEYIARVWRNHAGEPCVWRLRPSLDDRRVDGRGQIRARVDHPRPPLHLPRTTTDPPGPMSSVLTWGPVGGVHPRTSSRLKAVQASPHAMWNYVTYRDAIRVLGLDPDEIYPDGATRLDPAHWVDLGWLTCFAGPPESAVTAMREAVNAEALNQYPPDLLEPLRDEAARFLGAKRGPDLEVIGTAGAQEGISLSLMATVDTGR